MKRKRNDLCPSTSTSPVNHKDDEEDKNPTDCIMSSQENLTENQDQEISPPNEEAPMEESILSALNPLDMDDIVQIICSYLPVNCLKNARLISKLWEREATKLLVNQAYIRIPTTFKIKNQTKSKQTADEGNVTYLQSLLSLESPSPEVNIKPTFNLHVRDRQEFSYFEKHVTQNSLINTFFLRIRHLKYSGENTEDLNYIIWHLPNLSRLDTGSLVIGGSSSHDFRTQIRMQRITREVLQKLNTLNQVNFNFTLTPSLLRKYTNEPEDVQKLHSVNSFQIGGSQYEIQEILITYLDKVKTLWSPTSVSLYSFGVHGNSELTRQFLSMLSGSLKKLNLRMPSYSNYNRILSNPIRNIWTDNWLLPLCLTRLETLEIGCYYRDDEFILSRTITAALQLPNLKKLSITTGPESLLDRVISRLNQTAYYSPLSVSRSVNLNDDSYERPSPNSSSAESVTKLQCKSLRELSIYNSKAKIYRPTFFTSSLWPQLTSLTVKFDDYPFLNQSVLSSIFADYGGSLERLDLDIRFDFESYMGNLSQPLASICSRDKDYWNFDQLITGRKQENLGESSSASAVGEASITNLKKLKSLKITSVCPQDLCMTDVSIHNALMHMSSLQNLELRGHNFSSDGIQTLKSALGSVVCVQLSTLELSCHRPPEATTSRDIPQISTQALAHALRRRFGNYNANRR